MVDLVYPCTLYAISVTPLYVTWYICYSSIRHLPDMFYPWLLHGRSVIPLNVSWQICYTSECVLADLLYPWMCLGRSVNACRYVIIVQSPHTSCLRFGKDQFHCTQTCSSCLTHITQGVLQSSAQTPWQLRGSLHVLVSQSVSSKDHPQCTQRHSPCSDPHPSKCINVLWLMMPVCYWLTIPFMCLDLCSFLAILILTTSSRSLNINSCLIKSSTPSISMRL